MYVLGCIIFLYHLSSYISSQYHISHHTLTSSIIIKIITAYHTLTSSQESLSKSSTGPFLRELYVVWSVLGRYVQRLNETCYDQLLGCSCTCCMHDLFVRKSQPFSPSWNCPRANAYSIIDARSYTTKQLTRLISKSAQTVLILRYYVKL